MIPRRRSSLGRKLGLSVVACCLTLILILGLGELAARLFFERNPLPPPPPASLLNPYRSNPYIVNIRPFIYTHIPGASYRQDMSAYTNPYQFNSIGFRGPELGPFPPADMQRLLIIGDSVVEGHGVDFTQTFSFLLGTRLAGDHWQTVNAGVQGASPIYFAANTERYLSLHPDAVLLMIHENDLFDDEQREHAYFHLPITEEAYKLLAGSSSPPLLLHSDLYCLLSTAWQKLRRSTVEIIIERNASLPGVFADRPQDKKKFGTSIPTDQFDRRWSMSTAYLNYLVAALRENNITPLVSSLCTTSLAFPGNRIKAEHCTNLTEHVSRWAKDNNIPAISLVAPLQNAFRQHDRWQVLIKDDFHPTPMSHALLADSLYPFVAKELTGKE